MEPRRLRGAARRGRLQSELQTRVADHVAFCPREAAIGRLRAWTDSGAVEEATRLGDRLCVLVPQTSQGGAWFPAPGEIERLTAQLLPGPRIVRLADGPISRPDLSAAAIREISARI